MLVHACWLLAAVVAGSPQQVTGDTDEAPAVDAAYAAGYSAGLESASTDERFLEHFSARDPFYFLIGNRGQANARFQLSFQYDFNAPAVEADGKQSFWNGLAFAYTQQSLWDLQSDSVPFFDTNYRPSLFWYRESVIGDPNGPRWDFELGYEHESNGRGGDDSRSINTLYVRPTYCHPIDERWEFRTTPRVWTYIGDLSDNPDIADYRGWFDWRLQLVDAQGFGFSTDLRKGGASSYGSVQVDLTYPLNRLFGRCLDLFLHLQYFNGWGETLLLYDVKPPAQLRLGVALVR